MNNRQQKISAILHSIIQSYIMHAQSWNLIQITEEEGYGRMIEWKR